MTIAIAVTISMTIVAIARLGRPLAIMMAIIAMVSIAIAMSVVAISRLSRSFAIMMSIISSIMIGRISITIIARLSNSSGFSIRSGFSFSYSISSRLSISYSISFRFSISRPLSIVMSIIAMVSIAVTIAMTIVAIARLSCSNAQDSKGDGNQKIHCCLFLKLR